MIKDLIVNLGLGERDPAGKFAISIAEAFEAHVLGVAFAYEPVVPGSVMGGIPPEFIETQRVESEKTARARMVPVRVVVPEMVELFRPFPVDRPGLLRRLIFLFDHDSGPCGVNIDLHLARSALDLNPSNAGAIELFLQVLAELDVLVEQLLIIALGEPAAVPGPRDSDSKSNWIDFLTHFSLFGLTAPRA